MALDVTGTYLDAVATPFAQIDVKADIRGRLGDIRVGDISILDGEVTHEWDESFQRPVAQTAIQLHDEDHELDPRLSNGDLNPLWFNCQLDLRYRIRADGPWSEVRAFRGRPMQFRRRGHIVDLHCVGKEQWHMPPRYLRRTWEVAPDTKYSQAIIDLIQHRGIDNDIIDIPVLADDAATNRYYHFVLGDSPWEIMQNWSKELGRQLYYRMSGFIRLRDLPQWDEPAVIFDASPTSLLTEVVAQTYSMDTVRDTAVVLTERFVNDGPNAADRPEPVVGYFTLPDEHAFSAETMSGGNKPSIIIAERPGKRWFTGANAVAQKLATRQSSGVELEIELESVPRPDLEPLDVAWCDLGDEGIEIHKFRLKRWTYGLTPDNPRMSVNHAEHRKPSLHHHGPRGAGRRQPEPTS